MLTLTIECDVPPERTVRLQLPDQVLPGKHQLLVVVDAADSGMPARQPCLGALAGAIPRFSGLDAVAWQRQLRDEWP